jgi:hypothetical protein
MDNGKSFDLFNLPLRQRLFYFPGAGKLIDFRFSYVTLLAPHFMEFWKSLLPDDVKL